MAKYSLILRDQTFIKLMQDASAKGLTFGKYINAILNDLAEKPERTVKPQTCFVCGEKPFLEIHGFNGVTLYLCRRHQEHKNIGQGWLEIV